MTELKRLTVSLTKHGAHKIARLLEIYDKDEVLAHVANSVSGINIELAQAKKNLSANPEGVVPDLWDHAKERGGETIDALVLLAIIFSHHELISAMKHGQGKAPFTGTITRGEVIDHKAFTNFAHIIEELGYSTDHSSDHIDYDLHRLFQIKGLNELFASLLTMKLEAAGWDKKVSVIDEACSLRFYEVFSVTEQQFTNWQAGAQPQEESSHGEPADTDFFFKADDKPSTGDFVFKPGHTKKKTGTVAVKTSTEGVNATLLHNEVQNAFFAELVKKYGEGNVGTENETGDGTSIDIVVKVGELSRFYEIKTASSVKASIRQAIPQLLEYAYWHGKDNRADHLIIVSPLPITAEANIYLSFLRDRFALPIYYEQYLPKAN